MSDKYFHVILYIWAGFALVLFPLLLKIPAPYGRHNRKGWGPVIPNQAGWIIMELPSLVIFLLLSLSGPEPVTEITWIFIAFWAIHYTNRTFIYPLRTHTRNKKMPLVIALFAIFFNLINGSLNGYYFGYNNPGYSFEWIMDVRFLIGVLLFLGGFLINVFSDNKLLSLRKNSSNGYIIPYGVLFKYISCPNFFGEILEWTGFALMTWSPAALTFAIWTFVNLVPRALDHHRWYKQKFPDYPERRKAIIPFIL